MLMHDYILTQLLGEGKCYQRRNNADIAVAQHPSHWSITYGSTTSSALWSFVPIVSSCQDMFKHYNLCIRACVQDRLLKLGIDVPEIDSFLWSTFIGLHSTYVQEKFYHKKLASILYLFLRMPKCGRRVGKHYSGPLTTGSRIFVENV